MSSFNLAHMHIYEILMNMSHCLAFKYLYCLWTVDYEIHEMIVSNIVVFSKALISSRSSSSWLLSNKKFIILFY